MKIIRTLLAAAAASLTLLPAEAAPAQTPEGMDFQNMDPQVLRYGLEHFQELNPQAQQAALGLFRSSSPQQQAAVIRQFLTLNPQQQQVDMEQFQRIDPELVTNLVQRHVDAPLREQMAVTDDDEWALIESRVAAVMKARTALVADNGGGNRGFQDRLRARGPEAQALQKALDADAPAPQVRSLLATYRAAHQEKQAVLVRAQDDLRAVLSIRQEAVALVWNLLD